MLQIYIGYDERQRKAFEVCRSSILDNSTAAVKIDPISRHSTFQYSRYAATTPDGQQWDCPMKGKYEDLWPVSTDFAMARFWVPMAQKYEGWALYVDCDFVFMGDVAELFAMSESGYPVMVVKHNYLQEPRAKMDGRQDRPYTMKNWSSLMLFNCAHPQCRMLDAQYLNSKTFLWMHQFEWTDNVRQTNVGELPLNWNWIDIPPKAVHFTNGLPDVAGYENQPYADAWRSYASRR